jgi:hypothetical protein
MVLIFTVLTAFPIGFLVGGRLAANTTYAVVYLWAFVFQGVYLMLEFVHGDADAAFEDGVFPWEYGLVTLTIFVAGFGLVQLGHRVGRGRRERRQESSRSSLTGTSANAAMGNAAASANVAG